MSETTTGSPNGTRYPEATPEQLAALRDAEVAMGGLEAELRHVLAATQESLRGVEAPRKHAAAQLAEAQDQLAQAAKLPDSPEKAYALQVVAMQFRMWEGVGIMLDAQTACDRKNLALATESLEVLEGSRGDLHAWIGLSEAGVLTDEVEFEPPDRHVDYQRGRAQASLFLALYTWTVAIDGIDAVLRATGNPPALEPTDPAEAGGRERMAEMVRDEMAKDAGLKQMLHGAAAGLCDAWAYIEYAAPLLKSIGEMPPAMQASHLADPDLMRLHAQPEVLGGLLAKVQAYPAIAALFPEPAPAGLPWERDAAPAAATPSDRTGRTGPLMRNAPRPGFTAPLPPPPPRKP